jgi:arylsulfatase
MKTVQNVVLLSVDALRADHLSCHGYHRETTPNLDEFADEGLRFERAYSVSSHTREAVPGLLTGRYPDEAIGSDYCLTAKPISAHLREADATTAAFHSNPFISRAFGYDQGFDTFDDDLHLGKHKLIALAQRALDKLRNRHYARASEINDRSLSWLDSLADDDSFFLWNHYMDPHGPYIPVEEHRDLYTERQVSDKQKQQLYKRAIRESDTIDDDERQLLIDLYDAEIRYTDAQVEAFLDALDDRDLLAETLVIVTADHGDAFGEHGYYEHPRYLHEELTRVPLIVRTPDADADRVQTPASTLDIVPTVLGQFGIEADLSGRSLLKLAGKQPDNRVVFAQASGEDDDVHLRRFAAWSRTEQAFGEYDTEAEENQITERSDDGIAERLDTHIAERVRSDDRSQPRDEAVTDEEVEQRLSALGYKE